MTEKFVESDRGRTFYWVGGCADANAETLVFLHGLTADHTLFDRQVEHFSRACRVVTWDAPAHGKSRPYGPFTYQNTAEELRRVLDAEGVARAVLVGQSMGGYVTQAFLQAYPARAKAFVAIDTCPFGESYYSRSDKWWLRQIGWMSMCFPHGLLVRSMARSVSQTSYAYENMMRALAPYGKRELCSLMGIGYAGFLAENRDMTIPCPTLLLAGEHDRTGKVLQYCRAWSKNTGFPLYLIENAAHNANVDNPAATNAYIERFLTELDAR